VTGGENGADDDLGEIFQCRNYCSPLESPGHSPQQLPIGSARA
jgi:hypothetical protein